MPELPGYKKVKGKDQRAAFRVGKVCKRTARQSRLLIRARSLKLGTQILDRETLGERSYDLWL